MLGEVSRKVKMPGRDVELSSKVIGIEVQGQSCRTAKAGALLKVRNRYKIIFIHFLLCLLLVGCRNDTTDDLSPTFTNGEIVGVNDIYGKFYIYVPNEIKPNTNIVVIIHGTPVKEKTAEVTALSYIERWLDFADENNVVLIAPSFSEENFSSKYGEIEDKMTGYRGLFGKEIGADEWLLRIMEAYLPLFPGKNEKISLYGHSAGGQFVGRFIIMHPDVVDKAVITAAATYPQPTPDIAWPYGMGELHTDIAWDDETVNHVDIYPDQKKWLAATQIPLTVIVGMSDTAEQPQRPGQRGKTRIMIGRNWVMDMKEFARESGLECRWKNNLVPGIGHGDAVLVPFAQQAMESH